MEQQGMIERWSSSKRKWTLFCGGLLTLLLGILSLGVDQDQLLFVIPKSSSKNIKVQGDGGSLDLLPPTTVLCTTPMVGREPYVCQGPEYDAFADKMEQFILWTRGDPNNTLESWYDQEGFQRLQYKIKQQQQQQLEYMQQPTWGYRKYPFPANSTILAFGNSHTRSLFFTLACQYSTLLIHDEEMILDNETFPVRRGTYYRYEFANHAQVHLVSNHDLAYLPRWQSKLHFLTGHKLADFDVVIYGRPNDYYTPLPNGREEAHYGVTLVDVGTAYWGPLVGHTLIAEWGFSATSMAAMMRQRQQLGARRARTVALVDGRRYMQVLGPCSSDEWKTAGICENDETKHTCMGNRGAHGDLIVWDLLEAVHDVLEKAKTTGRQ